MTIFRNVLHPTRWYISRPRVERLLLGLIIVIVIAMGSFAGIRVLRPTRITPLLPGQRMAWAIARTLQEDATVQLASGSYLPGDGLFLYTRVTNGNDSATRTWAQQQLEPFAADLSQLALQERLIWVIDSVAAEQTNGEFIQLMVTTSLAQIADPLHYQYISNRAPQLTVPITSEIDNAPMAQGNQPPASDNPLNAVQSIPVADASPVSSLTGLEQPTAVAVNQTPMLRDSDALIRPVNAADPQVIVVDNFGQDPVVTTATTLRSFSFQAQDTSSETSSIDGWLPISGVWHAHDGIYSQLNTDGYDYITLLDLPKQRHYSLEVRLRLKAGDMGGGFIYNAPNRDNRVGAQLIDIDEKGRYLRWGYYDEAGIYIFEGGTSLGVGLTDGEWHQLRLVTQGEQSVVSFDDVMVGLMSNQSAEGYVGLIASRAQVDFDDFVVVSLPPAELFVSE